MDRDSTIGICGTFDVENYGDLLFPYLAEAALRQRLGPLTLQRFSYRHKALPAWPYDVVSLTELPRAAPHLAGMIIGGGDLIRFDKDVAPGYVPPTPDIHHPTGYWLSPALIALQNGRPLIWNAPGVHGDIPAWAEPLVEVILELSSYVSVRNDESGHALAHLARGREVHVVPDTAFGVAHLVNTEQPSPGYFRLRESLGLGSRYIIVQATSGLDAVLRLIRSRPHLLRDYQMVILPISPILGDDDALIPDDVPGIVRLRSWPAPLLIAELIGHAAGVVGISLHLAITSLAFGVPVFRSAETFGGKYAMLRAFDGVSAFENASEIDPRWFAEKLNRRETSSAVRDRVRHVSQHWDSIAAALDGDTDRPARLEALGRFWQSLPGRLETRAAR